MALITQSSTSNLLLRAMRASDFALLAPDLERVPLERRATLHEADQPIERIYFLEGGVASIVTFQEGGDQIETGLFGLEGMSGSAVVLGSGQSPNTTMIQVSGGPGLAIASSRVADACQGSHELHLVLLRFVQTLSVQTAATAAANAHFALPERLARWLLMCHDRVAGDRIELTHEFIATMLAVRRSGVTSTLNTLEATGAIRGTRGIVTILDRDRLLEIAGTSNGVPESEYSRLISDAPFH